jgi:hypothetical protein
MKDLNPVPYYSALFRLKNGDIGLENTHSWGVNIE